MDRPWTTRNLGVLFGEQQQKNNVSHASKIHKKTTNTPVPLRFRSRLSLPPELFCWKFPL